ncbi:MAG TPA: SAM-dependent methyltransferase [Hungateiclostridium thermocellum]|uniref:SAM dependent methyltransferase n=1 Tax=Acetivibrio thermocellus (strain ATCC 27405 / DSM 1237 / JCM 9322 / NBRC 103400 / NCIMB 10682 / NRRL B-4536 / VPI 7372) TaxID=203119 RepID=A3DK78_ACET2|nr:SAM-dependent methyltransferase [Acetivibrio thermocellus]CDG37645.1 SAM dependent methyltransferase [Acetivibrio thermocellus BC1]ABN54357.1 SAM dependent methyltransferase [Acetivibrio thermocellus ATCC 27405]NLU27219.1 SAM-dependent methyltransferase [Acetivibrio thermocellus]THJ79128.1 SAM-dependent methyltransferase [Acetivibrio thermocellus]HBW27986.1 SAM-dependent methyltransferase [Acetivibrio thermocellus]
MNKQSLNKLSLFLTGMEQRLIDNWEFFKGITAVFKSGTREFPAKVWQDGNKLKMNFSGSTETLESNWLCARIAKIAQNYDSVVINYEERGTTIIIEADDKNVRMKTQEAKEQKEAIIAHSETSHISNRDYYIKVGQADELLREIGILGSNGKIKNDMIRKYNQIDHFVELIDDMLKEAFRENESLTILDCGCGKSYLTFVLNYYIREVLKKPCRFIGLDYSSTVIEASKKIAQNLGYRNMEFKVTDIRNFHTSEKIHMVISLHACNTATDEAIALAVNNNVKAMVMVPCCQQEILKQYSYPPFEPIIKHGILKARMADVITDGIRALILEALGYKVSIVEYISPTETPKNLMLRAVKTQGPDEKALAEYKKLKEMLGINPTLEKLIYLK